MTTPKGKVSGRRSHASFSEVRLGIPKTAILCPHCKALSHFTPKAKEWNDEKAWTILECDGCGKIIFTIYEGTGGYTYYPSNVGVPTLKDKPIQVYPFIIPNYHESIPKEVGEDYKESLICHYAVAYNAAATMFRRAIQSSVLERGANPNKNLYEQINQLRDEGKIDARTAEWAHEIRFIGNVPGAHPDKVQPLRNVSKEE